MEIQKNTRQCSVQGCIKKYLSRGFCSAHYAQKKKSGELINLPPFPTVCTAADCNKKHWAKRLCKFHYQQLRQKENPHKQVEYCRKYRERHRDRYIQSSRKHHKKRRVEKPEAVRESQRQSYLRNRERRIEGSKDWSRRNPGRRNAITRLYEERKRRAVPRWADVEAIKKFYENCPHGYHVDHIIPIKGKNVSGLHVVDNLQYLPADQNVKKRNIFDPEKFPEQKCQTRSAS